MRIGTMTEASWREALTDAFQERGRLGVRRAMWAIPDVLSRVSASSKTRPEERSSAKGQQHKQQQGVYKHDLNPRWDARAPVVSLQACGYAIRLSIDRPEVLKSKILLHPQQLSLSDDDIIVRHSSDTGNVSCCGTCFRHHQQT